MNINERSELKFLNWSTNVNASEKIKYNKVKQDSKWERPHAYKIVEKII